MTPNIDIDLLRTFITVVDCGGFSAAAERLFRGQSAVSLQVKRLEERLGVRLLLRSPRHLSLTPEGEQILDHARRMLALNDELVARLAGIVGRRAAGRAGGFRHHPPAEHSRALRR